MTDYTEYNSLKVAQYLKHYFAPSKRLSPTFCRRLKTGIAMLSKVTTGLIISQIIEILEIGVYLCHFRFLESNPNDFIPDAFIPLRF